MHDKEAQVHSHYIVKLVPLNKFTELKISVFCDIMPCSQLKVNRSCRRIFRPHIQGWRVSQQAACFILGFSLRLPSSPEDGGDMFFRKWTARHYIREDRTRHNRRCDNLKAHTYKMFVLQNFNSFMVVMVCIMLCIVHWRIWFEAVYTTVSSENKHDRHYRVSICFSFLLMTSLHVSTLIWVILRRTWILGVSFFNCLKSYPFV
jgi:hypothetical protein